MLTSASSMPRISFRPDFISLLADDKARRVREEGKSREPPCDRDCVEISPGGLARGEADGRVRVALGWAAVWKNCSSFATVFRSSVPSTVFHAPLCFPKRPRRRLAGLPIVGPLSFSPLRPWPPLDAKASFRYTANFSLLSLFRRRTKRQRWPSRSPEKASFYFLPVRTEW